MIIHDDDLGLPLRPSHPLRFFKDSLLWSRLLNPRRGYPLATPRFQYLVAMGRKGGSEV